MPIRLKAVYFYNTPGWCDAILGLVKTFAKEKLKKRVYFCGYKFLFYMLILIKVSPLEISWREFCWHNKNDYNFRKWDGVDYISAKYDSIL